MDNNENTNNTAISCSLAWIVKNYKNYKQSIFGATVNSCLWVNTICFIYSVHFVSVTDLLIA